MTPCTIKNVCILSESRYSAVLNGKHELWWSCFWRFFGCLPKASSGLETIWVVPWFALQCSMAYCGKAQGEVGWVEQNHVGLVHVVIKRTADAPALTEAESSQTIRRASCRPIETGPVEGICTCQWTCWYRGLWILVWCCPLNKSFKCSECWADIVVPPVSKLCMLYHCTVAPLTQADGSAN